MSDNNIRLDDSMHTLLIYYTGNHISFSEFRITT